MKTMFLMLFVAAAACGVDSKADQRSAEVAECSITLAASSSAADVQQVLDDVDEGRLDPCTGKAAVRASSTSARLSRIERDERRIELYFRFFGRRLETP